MSYFFEWDTARDNHYGIEVIFTSEDIITRVDELAATLARWFDDEPVAHVVMNGAMMFAADLVRAMSSRGLVMEMDFLTVEKNRREGTRSLIAASNRPVNDRDVLIIDDIFETGRTIALAKEHFKALGANSVTTVCLLDKSQGKPTEARPDYIGFECPDVFVIGYGMDMGYRYRELPFIGKMGQC